MNQFKYIIGSLLVLWGASVQAGYECHVRLQDDLIVTPNAVQVLGASGDIVISPDGSVQRRGEKLSVSSEARQKAREYQSAVRRELPYIDQEAHRQLQRGKAALDQIVVRELGGQSRVRQHLERLAHDLSQELRSVLNVRDNQNMTFRHQAIQSVEQSARTRVEHALGAVVQDGINEMSQKSLQTGNASNPLQSLLGGVGTLQQELRQEWQQQEQSFEAFGRDVCARVETLEMQKAGLLSALPAP